MSHPRPLDPTDHLRRPWRVHALARAEALALHDVWEVDATLPPGATLAQWADALRRERQSVATRALFALRWGLGRVLGLDRGSSGFSLVYAEPEEQLHRIENRTSRHSCTSRSPGAGQGWPCTCGHMGSSAGGTCAASIPFGAPSCIRASWRLAAAPSVG